MVNLRLKEKGFRGGFFQQHDAQYPRSCLTLDYTPETLELVLDKFCAWLDRTYDTRRITIDGKTVRVFKPSNEAHSLLRETGKYHHPLPKDVLKV